MKSAFAHAADADDSENLIESILAGDPALVVAASDTLADAPPLLQPSVMHAILRLTATSTIGITGLVRAGADLIRNSGPTDAERFLDELLDALLSRGATSTPDVSPDFQRLIARVLEAPQSATTRDRLLNTTIHKYEAMPRAGRAAVLKHTAALEPGSPLNRTLTDIAIEHELPEDGAEDAAVLLARDWADPTTRQARGWTTWWELISAPLPTRWNSAVVRVFSYIATDTDGVLDPLIEETVRPTRESMPQRDRLNNASKYAAELAPDRTVAIMLRSPFADTAHAISSASQLARHIDIHLGNAQRVRMIDALIAGAHRNPGKAWPSIIKLATANDDLLSGTITKLEEFISSSHDGSGTLHRTIDGLVQAASSAQMVDLEPRLKALGRLVGGLDQARTARINASIAPLNSSARTAIDVLIDTPTREFDNVAITELARRQPQWPPGGWERAGLPWTIDLLRTRNQTAVAVIATMMRPWCVGPHWKDRYTAKVLTRQLTAINDDEDPQVAQHLMQVCADLVHREPQPANPASGVSADDVTQILDAYLHALTRGEAEPDGGKARRQIAAVYSCLCEALTDVAKKVLDEDAFSQRVQAVVTDIDTQPIGGQAGRGLAALLVSAVRTYPQIWASLEAAWPSLSEQNQRAVAECALTGRVTNGRSVILDLVRSGCHDSVAAYVHRTIGD